MTELANRRPAMRKMILAAIALSFPALAFADAATDAVKARQDNMDARAAQVEILAKMAKGEIEYESAAAQEAAEKLVEVFSVDMSGFWLPGTSSEDMPGVSYAKPALWENGEKVGEIGKQAYMAAQDLVQLAGSSKEEMMAGLGAVGNACQDCHKIAQARKN
ncbi:cytochrome c [Tropicimonas sp. IMCC6043]|uniref:cytochrome c n=1 Tax=Tropicimonas sp. IMCC6043 TaxID=2510645 RepID=UPI0013EB8738|nr:cytochrome c [Tropicimonas sp. IMCC6043]